MSAPVPPDDAPSRPSSPPPLSTAVSPADVRLPSPSPSELSRLQSGAASPNRPTSRIPLGEVKPGPAPELERPAPWCKCDPGRNLIVCIDGTSNQFSERNTNVVELYSRLVKDKDQLTFYNSGIGTYATPSWKSPGYYAQRLMNKLDLAFALRFEKIIISAYAWLADNYHVGDRIFLFGFSRGAYQVRALSAMINLLGLIHKGNDDQIPFAYELYAAGGKVSASSQTNDSGAVPAQDTVPPAVVQGPSYDAGQSRAGKESTPSPPEEKPRLDQVPAQQPAPSGQASRHGLPTSLRATGRDLLDYIACALRLPTTTPQNVSGMQKRFKDAFARDIRVHFVGAWDTVSSVGVARTKSLPGTTDGMGHVCFFRHALAIHEYRVKFLPEYVNGGHGPLRAGPVFPRVSTKTEASQAQPDTAPSTAITPGEEVLSSPSRPQVKEVWFSGSHSDIGGGATENPDLNKFGPSLRWMSFEARVAGARFKEEPRIYQDTASQLTRSLKPSWRALEILPFKRLTYSTPEGTTRWPHLAASRIFQKDQLLSWEVEHDLKTQIGTKMQIEYDPYNNADEFLHHLLNVIQNKPDTDLVTFRELLRSVIRSVPGQDSLRGVDKDIIPKLIETANHPRVAKDEVRSLVLSAIFGLAFAFDGTDVPLVGRSPQLAVRDFLQAVDRHITSVTSLDDSEKTMLKVLTGLDVGQAALRKDSPRAITAMHRILTEVPEADLDLFESVASVLSVDRVSCSFDTRGRIIKPDECDLIAIGSVMYLVIRRCVAEKKLPLPRERRMLQILRRTDRYPSSPRLEGLNERLSPLLRSLLILCKDIDEAAPDSETRSAARAVIKDTQYILDGFAFAFDFDTCEIRQLHSILEPTSPDTKWTVPELRGHRRPVPQVAFVPPGDRVASASWDNSVRVWDIFTGLEVDTSPMKHEDDVNCLAVTSAGHVISGSDDGFCIIWDSRTGKEISRSPQLDGFVYSVAIPASERTFAAGTQFGVLHILDMQNKVIRQEKLHDSPVLSAAYSPHDETVLASSSFSDTVLWNLKDNSFRKLPEQTDWVRSLAFAPDGTSLATGCDDGIIRIFDVDSATLRHQIERSVGIIYSVAYSPSGCHIVAGSGDGAVRLWDANTYEPVGEPLLGHTGQVLSVVVNDTATRIISGSMDRTIFVWDRVPFLREAIKNDIIPHGTDNKGRTSSGHEAERTDLTVSFRMNHDA